MTPDRWREVTRIYGAIVARPTDARAAAVDELCGADGELRAEVESLLAEESASGVVDRPVTARPSLLNVAMGLQLGSQIGTFRIEELLGVGGMGEVYRARDTRLNRDVAIKILPAAFAADPERLARFKREAQVLAALNHPNIAAIYGLEGRAGQDGREGLDGSVSIVMELVDGPTLAERLTRGPLPLDEALAVARQIAEALEAAHEQGIVHRDLKPANIKVRDDGAVKVLDFGLAKIAEPAGSAGSGRPGGANLTHSPTITTPAMTAAGIILGTAAYMSPEQAKGKPADKRSDIWAFGCVVYEMLTGKRAFDGEDVSDTLANVLKSTPDCDALPADTPPAIRRLLARALSKDRRRRLADMADARLELESPTEPTASASTAVVDRRSLLRRAMPWAVSGLAVAAALVLAFTEPLQSGGAPVRFTIEPPNGHFMPFSVNSGAAANLPLAVSPDGRQLVLIVQGSDGVRRLWIRALDSLTGRQLADTDEATAPFWSPDSRFVAFFAKGKLKKIDVSTGLSVPLCDLPSLNSGAWGRAGVIVVARAGGAGNGGELWKVPDSGGIPVPVTRLQADEALHIRPAFLPDGRHFLFRANSPTTSTGKYYVSSIDGMERTALEGPQNSGNVVYASGHVLFLNGTTLMAQPFDPDRLQLTGEPTPVADAIQTSQTGFPVGLFSASTNGVLAYQSGSSLVGTELVWTDRAGTVQRRIGDRANYGDVELSPDGERASVSVSDPKTVTRGVWIVDIKRGMPTQLTFNAGSEQMAVWAPDSSRLAFRVSGEGTPGLYEKDVDTVNVPSGDRLLIADSGNVVPWSWSSDGQHLLYSTGSVSNPDLWVLPLSGERKPFPLLQTPAAELGGRFSPDGRWVAYASNSPGRSEIYVMPFGRPGSPVRVSAEGGAEPRWRGDGREIFFLQGRTMMAADVDGSGGTFQVHRVRALFDTAIAGGPRSNYAVAADGQHFLINTPGLQQNSAPIVIVLNWPAALGNSTP